MKISIKIAQRLAKAGLLDTIAEVSEAAYRSGVESMRKRAVVEIISMQNDIAKGDHQTPVTALTNLEAYILNAAAPPDDTDLFSEYDGE